MDGEFIYRFVPADVCVMCRARESRVLGRRLSTHQGFRPRNRKAVATTVVQCAHCGLIYTNPRPIPENIEQHYAVSPEEYWDHDYFENRDFADEIQLFRRLWKGEHSPRALDIGAGIGASMLTLKAQGFDTYGIEPSPQFRERALTNGVSADRLRLATLEDAEFEPAAFDFVTFGAVLEHLHDPAAALERALEWLANGGLVHVEVPSARWLVARALNAVYRAQGLDYVTNLSPMHVPFHLYEFTIDAFRAHGRRAGYQVAFHQVLSCPTFLPKPLSAIATRVMDMTDTDMQLQVWLMHDRASVRTSEQTTVTT